MISKERVSNVPVTFVSSHSGDGGSERYLFRLIEGLGRDWVKEVICLQDGPLVGRLETSGYPTVVIDVPARPPRLLTRTVTVRRRLAQSSASLVHANGIKAAFVCGLATAGTPIDVLWVKHDFTFDGAFASFVGATVERVVGVSKASIEGLKGPAAKRATFVHAGVDHYETDRRAARRALLQETGWAKDSFIVGCVGRLDPAKGQAELIRAAANALHRVPSIHIVIAGSRDQNHPSIRDNLMELARALGIADRTVVFDERDDVRALIAAFDVGAIPTIALRRRGREGFSLVALEMLDAGTPVVAFRSGALPEVVGDCGILVDAGSIPALADAIVAIAEDRELVSRLTGCGRQRVAHDFTTARWIEQMKSHYMQLAGE